MWVPGWDRKEECASKGRLCGACGGQGRILNDHGLGVPRCYWAHCENNTVLAPHSWVKGRQHGAEPVMAKTQAAILPGEDGMVACSLADPQNYWRVG